jgi:hypothetical protein
MRASSASFYGLPHTVLPRRRTILAIHRELSRNHPSLDCWQLTFFSLNAALVVALDLFRACLCPNLD